jgi:hypothetical protein
MTAPDYYSEAHEVAAMLLERGMFEESNAVEEAIAGGSTATEILMRLRFTLMDLIAKEMPEEVTRKTQSLIRELDEALR